MVSNTISNSMWKLALPQEVLTKKMKDARIDFEAVKDIECRDIVISIIGYRRSLADDWRTSHTWLRWH